MGGKRKGIKERIVEKFLPDADKETLKQQKEKKSKVEKIAKKQEKRQELAIEDAKATHVDKYKFKVRRTSPPPTGFIGTFRGTQIDSYGGDFEEFLLDRYGGGHYTLQIYRGTVPDETELNFDIAGEPKESAERKDKFDGKGDNLMDLKDEIRRTQDARKDWPELITAIGTLTSPILGAVVSNMQKSPTDWKDIIVTAAPFVQQAANALKGEPTKIDEFATLMNLIGGNQINPLETMQQTAQFIEMIEKRARQGGGNDDTISQIGSLIANLVRQKTGEAPPVEDLAGEDPQDKQDAADEIGSAIAGVISTASTPEQAANGLMSVMPWLTADFVPEILTFLEQPHLKPEWVGKIGEILNKKFASPPPPPSDTSPPPDEAEVSENHVED